MVASETQGPGDLSVVSGPLAWLVPAVMMLLDDEQTSDVRLALGRCIQAENDLAATHAARALIQALRIDDSPASARALRLLQHAVEEVPSDGPMST